MLPHLREGFGNPSSGHVYGRRERQALELARAQVAELLGCAPEEIVFTSGGTESNNLALRGVAAALSRPAHLVTSFIEHPAVEQPCRALEAAGWEVTRLGVDDQGRVRPEQAEAAMRPGIALVSLMHGNNETGSLQPVAEVAAAARRRAPGVVIHSDAAQSVGKVRTRVDELAVDLLTIAGHKLCAPKGIGALYVRRGTPLSPLLLGAGHERGLRPGTEPVALAVGLGAACALASATLEVEAPRQRSLRDRLHGLLRDGVPALSLNGHPEERLPNTLNVSFPGVRGSALLAATPGIAASTGSACHEGGERPSAVLLAQGVPPEQALGALRLTLGRITTLDEVDRAGEELVRAWRELTA